MNLPDTIAVYDARAGEYAALAGGMTELAHAEAFAALLPAGARVLDLGAGPGFHAAWFAARGFRAEALDASAEMVALAARQPGVHARQGRFEDLPADPAWHGIWANFSLLHLPRAELPEMLLRLKRALVPGGLLHLGMKLGQGERTDALGRFYAYWRRGEIEALLVRAGFAVTACEEGRSRGLAGRAEPSVLIRAHG